MLAKRVVDWTPQGKEEGRLSERRALLRLIRRHLGEAAAADSAPLLEWIEEPSMLEDLFENLLDCPDESAWLARLRPTGEDPH